MVIDKIFDIASNVSTPLALGGFFAASFFFLMRQIIAKNIFPVLTKKLSAEIIGLIIRYVFSLSIISMFLGFLGYLITSLITSLQPQDKTWPAFIVEDSYLHPEQAIQIIADNKFAQRKDELHVRWDDLLLAKAAIPDPDPEIFCWQFNIRDQLLPKEAMRTGYHKLEIAFPGERFSKPIKIALNDELPIVETTIETLAGESDSRLLKGRAATHLQDPEEILSVDVWINSEGQPISAPLPVERKMDKDGRIYFQFGAALLGLPKISPDEPQYEGDFFAFKVTDQAGNTYYQKMSYAQFIAPGTQRFGSNRIADIEVLRHLEDVQKTHYVTFLVTPEPLREFAGQPAIDLNVTVHGRQLNKLNWVSELEQQHEQRSPTIVFRDDRTVAFVIEGNSYVDDVSQLEAEVSYQVQQQDKDGQIYISNLVTISSKPPDSSSASEKGAARTSMAPTTTPQFSLEPNQFRAVSMRNLQRQLKECSARQKCPDIIAKLANLTRISGFIIDQNNQDLLLFGEVENKAPALYTEDFIVALRNVLLQYAHSRHRTQYYESPGCSIDPDPEVFRELNRISQEILSASSNEKIEKGIAQWLSECKQPQQLRVFGVPLDSRFAKIMIEADYNMKRLVDGSIPLNMGNFVSLADMRIAQVKQSFFENKKPPVISPLNRFWFYPGDRGLTYDDEIFIINKCGVKLLTEITYFSHKNKLMGKNQTDDLAQQFANNFTKFYREIAQQQPIYWDLENLFRFVMLANVMKRQEVLQLVNLDYLVEEFEIPAIKVSTTLPGIGNVKSVNYERGDKDRLYSLKLWLPTCGGVSIAFDIRDNDFVKDETGKLSKIRDSITQSRPSFNALFWDIVIN